jgi:L-cysteine:1D-myo-inositol 2-amino-2-deoxy-alpha-D-glucopyranoside ligase
VRTAIADDLDTRGALAAVDDWAERTLGGEWVDQGAPGLVARTVDAVLGVRL